MSFFKKILPTCISPTKSPPKKTTRYICIDQDEETDEEQTHRDVAEHYFDAYCERQKINKSRNTHKTENVPAAETINIINESMGNEFFGINAFNVDEFENSHGRQLDIKLFYAYLCYLSMITEKDVLIVSPEYSKLLFETELGNEVNLPLLQQYVHSKKESYEFAFISVYMPDRYGFAIYERNKSIKYFDPMGEAISFEERGRIKYIVQKLNEEQAKPRLYQAKEHTYNKAKSNEDTGIHCCAIARYFLLLNGETAVKDFNINYEKQKIVYGLRSGINGNFEIQSEAEKTSGSTTYYAVQRRMRKNAESFETTEQRRKDIKERMRFSRNNETNEEVEERRNQDRERARNRRELEKRVRMTLYQQGSRVIDDMDQHQLGYMDKECMHCKALHFAEEATTRQKQSFNDCCRHGKIELERLPEPPILIRELFEGEHEWSKFFFKNIRSINSNLSFASLNPIPQLVQGRGPKRVKVQGQITYLVNAAILPDSSESPSYGQLYIVDGAEARNIRAKLNPNVEPNLIWALSEQIKNINQIAHSYEMMMEEYRKLEQIAAETGSEVTEVRLLFHSGNHLDEHQYNIPRINEIAAVFVPGADNEVPETMLMVHPIGKELTPLNCTNAIVDPMIYPLFFPYGNFGWHPQMHHIDNERKRITRAEYVSYRIFSRLAEYNVLLYGRDLFQMFCAEYSVRILRDRLNYIRFNQKKIMADLRKNIQEQMKKRSEESGLPIGRKIILPSSVTGTPRWEAQQFADAMTMVMQKGRPDIFITMTCNPKWPEITENLLPHQQAVDRPDLVARVFDLKKDAMIDAVMKKGLLGEVTAYVYVIEWQGRGLPHCHTLITLANDDKMRTAADVDKYIQAQFPDQENYPKLYSLVEKHMLHGPHLIGQDGFADCGCFRPDRRTGTLMCRFGFPKEFIENTTVNEDGYPTYARPDNDRHVVKRGIVLDNRWIAPYNPWLLLHFDCHINVERVYAINSIKYMYKYIYKGPDRTELRLQKEATSVVHDEISRYIDGRYVSAPEGVWHILRKKVQDKSHTIVRLPVHLENEQTVCFSEEATDEEVEIALESRKMLTAYFELNKTDSEAADYFYHQIPQLFVWKKNKWDQRKEHFNTLGRMQHVNPSEGERFYLRLLLCNVKGAKSFNELFEFDGTIYDSYKAVCLARGLILDNTEWIKAMDEAVTITFPAALRVFFARLLVHCNPANPVELWERYKVHLSEDYFRESGDEEMALRRAYKEIAMFMVEEGKPISQFPGMPELPDEPNEIEDYDRDDLLEQAMEKYAFLNDDQKYIVDHVLAKLGLPIPTSSTTEIKEITNMIFIDGPGGTGKTTVYKVLNMFMTGYGLKVYNAAFTGIAATLLPSGRTIHNLFGLPVPLFSDSNSNISPSSKLWQDLLEADAFLLDEASMIPKHALRIIEDLMRTVAQNGQLFGGKLFILGGDFRQILPIQRHATRAQQVNLSIKSITWWKHFTQFKLTENMRALEEEKEFAKWLLEIGNGDKNDEDDYVILPEDVVSSNNLEQEIFSAPIARENWNELGKRAILAPLHIDVDEINENVLKMLPGEQQTYKSIDEAKQIDGSSVDANLFPQEFINNLRPQGFSQHELNLKKHSIVMLIRNLNIKRGLSNGTRFEVIGLHKHLIECKIIGGERAGQIELIPRITLHNNDEYPFVLCRHQFPLRLAFAFTINKSQGQTLEKVGIDLRTDVFSHGQLYVAISRARSFYTVKVLLKEDNDERKVKNIVYKEILCEAHVLADHR